MKKYTLDYKYIRSKYATPMAVVSCIYDTIVINVDNYDKQQKNSQVIIRLSNVLSRILRIDKDPDTLLKFFDPLEITAFANCYKNIDEAVRDVEAHITEQIIIEFRGLMCDPEIMQFVPDFNPEKVKIVILNPAFPSVEEPFKLPGQDI